MAGKSGWETLHDLKTSPDTAAIPVIIASSVDERKIGAALGAVESLVKPFANEVFLRAVRKTLHSEETLHVLIVDDDPGNPAAMVQADTLLAEGHSPMTAPQRCRSD